MKVCLFRTYNKGTAECLSAMFECSGAHQQAAFSRFLSRLSTLMPGDSFDLEWRFPRSPEFHRAHFRMMGAVFNSQEVFSGFKIFRAWAKIGAGFVEFVPSPESGTLMPVPRSVEYAALEDEAFRQFHFDTIAFLRSHRATSTLWPHLDTAAQSEMMETLLSSDVR